MSDCAGLQDMVTAKQRYVSRALARKYGVVGLVAGRYVEAGYSVEMFHQTRYGPVQFLTRKRGLLVVEVYDKGIIEPGPIKVFHEKARLLGARPIVVLYGSGVKLSEEAKSYCEQNNIKVRRVLT